MVAFLESPIFPGCPKFGYISTILYSVDIVETAGGDEFRNLNWSEHRRTVQVTVGPDSGEDDEDIENLAEFYHIVGGTAGGFRVQDYADYKSGRTFATPTMLDQPLVETDAGWQLTKRYIQGAVTRDKSIYKPFGDILIADGSLLNEGSDYSIDMTNGLVQFSVTPSNPTWGGQYHIPCRFDSDFPVEIISRNANRFFKAATFTLKELRFEDN